MKIKTSKKSNDKDKSKSKIKYSVYHEPCWKTRKQTTSLIDFNPALSILQSSVNQIWKDSINGFWRYDKICLATEYIIEACNWVL